MNISSRLVCSIADASAPQADESATPIITTKKPSLSQTKNTRSAYSAFSPPPSRSRQFSRAEFRKIVYPSSLSPPQDERHNESFMRLLTSPPVRSMRLNELQNDDVTPPRSNENQSRQVISLLHPESPSRNRYVSGSPTYMYAATPKKLGLQIGETGSTPARLLRYESQSKPLKLYSSRCNLSLARGPRLI